MIVGIVTTLRSVLSPWFCITHRLLARTFACHAK